MAATLGEILIHELGALVGAIGEQVLEPGPALAHAVEDHLRAGAVRDVGGGEVDHQQTTVSVDGDMSLGSDDLLASVITSCFRLRSLDRLAVDDADTSGSPRVRPAHGQASAPRRGWSGTGTAARTGETTSRPSAKAESPSATSASRRPSGPDIGSRSKPRANPSGPAARSWPRQAGTAQSAPTPRRSSPSGSAWSSSQFRPSGHASLGSTSQA